MWEGGVHIFYGKGEVSEAISPEKSEPGSKKKNNNVALQ